MTLSTKLTISRLISVPVYLPAYLLLDWIGQWICLLLVWWAAFSDIMDGRLARARGEVSDQGKFLDPIADSSFFVTVFFCFAWSGLMPWWMFGLIACREFFQNVILRPYFNRKGIVSEANEKKLACLRFPELAEEKIKQKKTGFIRLKAAALKRLEKLGYMAVQPLIARSQRSQYENFYRGTIENNNT